MAWHDDKSYIPARPMTPPKRPVEVTGIWLDAHSGCIRVRAEIGGEWRTVIEIASSDDTRKRTP